jgi:uncharacterized protein YjbI with pentapeptide repeats
VSRFEPPKRPDLEAPAAAKLPAGDAIAELALSDALVSAAGREPLAVGRLRVEESELHGVALAPGELSGLALRDVILHGCDLSNLHCHKGSMRRV